MGFSFIFVDLCIELRFILLAGSVVWMGCLRAFVLFCFVWVWFWPLSAQSTAFYCQAVGFLISFIVVLYLFSCSGLRCLFFIVRVTQL